MKAGDMTDGIFLIHIVDALQETITFTEDVECDAFLESKLLKPNNERKKQITD